MKPIHAVIATGFATLLAGTITLNSRPAEANPRFTQQTGKPCGFCHTQPPSLNGNGKKFKEKGHKL